MKQASSDLYTQTASACGKGRRAVTDSGSPSLRLGRLRVTYLDIQSSMQLGLWLYAYHDRTTASCRDTGPASRLAPCLSTNPSLEAREALVIPKG
jgi:hypothetical protein